MQVFPGADDLRVKEKGLKLFASDYIRSVVETAASGLELIGSDEVSEAFFDEQIAKLCDIQVQAQATAAAVGKVSHQYATLPEEARRDLKLDKMLKEQMEAEYAGHPLKEDLYKTDAWAAWCRETGRKAPVAAGDEELEIAKGGDYKSMRCALSQRHIFSLDEPVEDGQGYIWEKKVIEDFIRSRGRNGAPVENPAAQGVYITLEELRRSKRVLRDAARHQKEKETQPAAECDIVL